MKEMLGVDAPVDADDASKPIELQPTGYDEHAILSYLHFCRLRNEGVIPAGVRFQVGLPTPLNVIAMFVLPAYQIEAEKLYEAALLKSLRNIQANIPKEDLAIQWDMPLDMAFLEYAKLGPEERASWLNEPYSAVTSKPWFDNVEKGIMERTKRMIAAVDEGVEMGFHFCYGDLTHKHFIEPADTSMMVDLSNKILAQTDRKIGWVHMPVPKDRVDEKYYEPLADLKLKGETELYLGLIHAGDMKGTGDRIEVAGRFAKSFGVSTECGCGRSSEEEFRSILDIAKAITA